MHDVHRIPYFAYGSNMDRAQMHHRCPGAVGLEVALLKIYRFMINSRGVASVVQHPSAHVYGTLWKITSDHERALDRYEGVQAGHYDKTIVRVETTSGNVIQALVYVASDTTTGLPRLGYMEKIIGAAEEVRLPSLYLKELRTWLVG